MALFFSDPWAVRVMANRGLQYLGRISYSLYLVHLVVQLAIIHAFYGRFPLSVLVPVALILTVLAADLINRFIEQPSQRLSHRLFAVRAKRARVTPASAAYGTE